MAMTTKKKVTSTQKVSKKTGEASAPDFGTPMARNTRTRAPGLMSRVQEKAELAALNDRLANYIDRVRQLEGENQRFSLVKTEVSMVIRELTGIEGIYEDEVDAARKLVDDMAADKAKLQVEVGKLNSELGDLAEKLCAREKEDADAGRRCQAAETRVGELQPEPNDSDAQRVQTGAQSEKLKKECVVVSKSLDVVQRQLELETIAQVDLENHCQSLKEKLAFLKQVHDQEMNELMTRMRVVVSEADEVPKVEYDKELREALRQVRKDLEEELRIMREETETVFQKRMMELHKVTDTGKSFSAELRTTRSQLDELKSELTRLNSQNAAYEARVHTLEGQLQMEQEAHQGELEALNAELWFLRNSLDNHLHEFQGLIDVMKVLDVEISTYQSLLESEESRLGIYLDKTSTYEASSPGKTKKRKLVEHKESFTRGGRASALSSFTGIISKSSVNDVVKIDETRHTGQFIKLCNTSTDKGSAGQSSKTKDSDLTKSGVELKELNSMDCEPSDNPQVLMMTPESELNCSEPVFRELISCTAPVDHFLPELTKTTWMIWFNKLLRLKKIKTIGNLSSLSELEVHNLPKVDNLIESLEAFARSNKMSLTCLQGKVDNPSPDSSDVLRGSVSAGNNSNDTEDHQEEQLSNVTNVELEEPSLVQNAKEQTICVEEPEYEEILSRLLNQELCRERAVRLLDLSQKLVHKCFNIVNGAVNSNSK